MSHVANDEWYEARGEWLVEHGAGSADLMSDEKGGFIMEEYDDGDDGDGTGYHAGMRKLYLPEHLQVGYDYQPD